MPIDNPLKEIKDGEPVTAAHIAAIRSDGLTFLNCVHTAAANKELITEFDRLTQSNLSLRGSSIELLIDNSTGRTTKELEKFLRFVWNCIFIRAFVSP